jgi:hypothetical protein
VGGGEILLLERSNIMNMKRYSVYNQRQAFCGEFEINADALPQGIEMSALVLPMWLADVPKNDPTFYHIEGGLDDDYIEVWGYDGHCYMTMIEEEAE